MILKHPTFFATHSAEVSQAVLFEMQGPGELSRNDKVRFWKEAQEFHSFTGQPSEFVQFKVDCPTYANLNDGQRSWYFYWRTEARRGNYLPTDTGYLFLHAYEILNIVEKPDPLEAAAYLKVLWMVYRNSCKEVNLYFPEWSGDLIAEQCGVDMALDWWEEMLEEASLPAVVLNAIVHRALYANRLADMLEKMWWRLTDYHPINRFSELHNIDGSVTEKCIRSLIISDEYWRAKAGCSVFEQFVVEDLKPSKKELFVSAPTEHGHPTVCFDAARNYIGNSALSRHLGSVMRYAENVLREQANFRPLLSDIELSEELKRVIKDILLYGKTPPSADLIAVAASDQSEASQTDIGSSLALTQQWPEPLPVVIAKPMTIKAETDSAISVADCCVSPIPPATSQKLRLNADLIKKLQRENEELIAILGEEGNELEEGQSIQDVSKPSIDEIVVFDDSTDEWQRLFSRLTVVEMELVKMLSVTGVLSEAQVEQLARDHGLMPAALSESLNDKAIEIFEYQLISNENDHWSMYDEDALDMLRARLT